jgi:hypothetical protein
MIFHSGGFLELDGKFVKKSEGTYESNKIIYTLISYGNSFQVVIKTHGMLLELVLSDFDFDKLRKTLDDLC